MKPRVLFVDDEPHVLDALRRQLRNQFEVETTTSGDCAEELLRREPFAVVTADYRMPGMNGVELLARARQLAPHTVRVVLTGQADMEAAIAAINDGNIFRFLTKPCPTVTLLRVLHACVKQHQLLVAERELLERTLSGSVKVLTEILALVSPDAFGRAMRVKDCVAHVARVLELPDPWQYEVAAMLSQIGCVTLSGETIAKIVGGDELSREERESVAAHPAVARTLLSNVPRLDGVARIIAGQLQSPGPAPQTFADLLEETPEMIGVRLLRLALALDHRVARGLESPEAVADVKRTSGEFPAVMLDALDSFAARSSATRVETVYVRQLNTLMVLDQDVRARSGLLLVSRGQQATVAVIQRLHTFARGVGVAEPFRVRIPTDVPVTERGEAARAPAPTPDRAPSSPAGSR